MLACLPVLSTIMVIIIMYYLIIEPPVLKVMREVILEENRPLSFNMEQSAGYPPVPSFQWYFNGEEISPSSSNPNVSVYPQIVFSPVLRNQSGNYSMIASTEGGDSTGYFTLDVQCECINNT